MNGYDGPRRMRFRDGRTGLLSPFGVDTDGVYEVTDSTAELAEQYRAEGLIEYVDEPAGVTPVLVEDTAPVGDDESGQPDDEE